MNNENFYEIETEETEDCGICLGDIVNRKKCSDCNFIACTICIEDWFVEKQTCPQCRKKNTWEIPQSILNVLNQVPINEQISFTRGGQLIIVAHSYDAFRVMAGIGRLRL